MVEFQIPCWPQVYANLRDIWDWGRSVHLVLRRFTCLPRHGLYEWSHMIDHLICSCPSFLSALVSSPHPHISWNLHILAYRASSQHIQTLSQPLSCCLGAFLEAEVGGPRILFRSGVSDFSISSPVWSSSSSFLPSHLFHSGPPQNYSHYHHPSPVE